MGVPWGKMRECIPIWGKIREEIVASLWKVVGWGGSRGDQEEAMETHLLQDISMFDIQRDCKGYWKT